MKKYVKPELFFENYELSQHIAACAWDLIEGSLTGKNGTCRFDGTDAGEDPGVTLLTDTNGCTINDYYCYSNGSNGRNIFNS